MRDFAPRVLIVDPDPVFAGKAMVVLSAEGYDVETATGITLAAERLKDVDFGCAIVDEHLPEMRGHEAVPVLKTIAPDVQIIMTAARNSPELESSIRRRDIFYYHVKSFGMHELQQAVRDAFRKVGGRTKAGRNGG